MYIKNIDDFVKEYLEKELDVKLEEFDVELYNNPLIMHNQVSTLNKNLYNKFSA